MRKNEILYRKLEQSIKNKEIEQADSLTEELLKEEGLEIHPSMPEGFADRIRFVSKESRRKMKNKMIKTAAIATLCVLGAGGTAYAGASFIQNLMQDGKGAVVFTQPQSTGNTDITLNEPSGIVFDNPAMKVSKEDWYQQLYADEKVGTYTYMDESPLYTSDDGKKWTKEEGEPKAVVDRYVFASLQEAFHQAGIANILAPLEGEYTLTSNLANCYETYSDQDKTVQTKSVRVVMKRNKEQKIIADIDKSLIEEESEQVTAVINGINVENYREVTTSNGVNYALQDVKDKGNEHVAANLSAGSYRVSIKFYNMTEKEIKELLENIAVTQLK